MSDDGGGLGMGWAFRARWAYGPFGSFAAEGPAIRCETWRLLWEASADKSSAEIKRV